MAHTTIPEGLLNSNFDGIMKANAHNMENMAHSYSTFLQRLGKLNAETMKFCAERWKEDLEVPAKIAQSKEPGEVAEVYADFYKKMFEDYSDQAYRVMDMVGELGWEYLPTTANGQADDKSAKAPAKKTQ